MIFENLVGRLQFANEFPNLESSGTRKVTPGRPGENPKWFRVKNLTREFDPGSESTLAARLTHASRTRKPDFGWASRVANG